MISIGLPLNDNDEVRAATWSPSICPSALMISSEMPSLKNSFSASNDQEVDAILTSDVIECADVRMIQPGDRASFVLEAHACLRIVGHVRGQTLSATVRSSRVPRTRTPHPSHRRQCATRPDTDRNGFPPSLRYPELHDKALPYADVALFDKIGSFARWRRRRRACQPSRTSSNSSTASARSKTRSSPLRRHSGHLYAISAAGELAADIARGA